MSIKIIGLGATHPEPDEMMSLISTVEFLKKKFNVEVAPDDIETMREIGMESRYISTKSSDELILEATLEALQRAEAFYTYFNPHRLQIVICGGSTLPRSYPSQSCWLAKQICLPEYQVYPRDISGACSSWTQAFITAADVMKARNYAFGLVGCGEVIASRSNDPQVGKHFLMWDDNGSACVLEYDISCPKNYGVIGTFSGCDYKDFAESVGSGSDYVIPITQVDSLETVFYSNSRPNAQLNSGSNLFRYIINKERVARLITEKLADHQINLDDERVFFVPHGANLRMVHTVAEHVGFCPDNVLTMLGPNGRSNMSSASIPTTLEHYSKKPGFFRKDDVLVLVSYSGGLLVDIILYRIADDYFVQAFA